MFAEMLASPVASRARSWTESLLQKECEFRSEQNRGARPSIGRESQAWRAKPRRQHIRRPRLLDSIGRREATIPCLYLPGTLLKTSGNKSSQDAVFESPKNCDDGLPPFTGAKHRHWGCIFQCADWCAHPPQRVVLITDHFDGPMQNGSFVGGAFSGAFPDELR